MDKRLYKVDEAAGQLGVSRAFVYELLASGQLRHTKLGRATRIAPEDLEAFVQAKRAESRTIPAVA